MGTSLLYLMAALMLTTAATLSWLLERFGVLNRMVGVGRLVGDVMETDFFDDSGGFDRPSSRVVPTLDGDSPDGKAPAGRAPTGGWPTAEGPTQASDPASPVRSDVV